MCNCMKGTKNTRSYWRMLRRLNKNNSYPIKISDPNNNDRLIEDPTEIKKVLREYWEKLGNSASSQEGLNPMKQKISDLYECSEDKYGFVNIDINVNIISESIAKLKCGKSCGIDNIPNEFLKYGGPVVSSSLEKLFRHCKLLETFPDDWFKGLVKPLFKEGKPEVLDNYRGITITSNVYKVFTSVMENQLMSFLEHENILGELHGAYRKGRRLEDHIYY